MSLKNSNDVPFYTMKTKFLFLFILCCTLRVSAQEKQLQIKPKALDIGVYDYSKVKKNPYKIYRDREADVKFTEMLMQNEKLKNSGLFGQYIKQDNDSIVFFMEEEAYEYCPELNYVMKTGGHGFVSAYDLATLEEIFVNPSSYVYSPSGNYRFGTFEYDGMKYYLEVKEGDKYVPYLLFYGVRGSMEGVYWVDDETIHDLKEMEKPDGSKYQIGYSAKFYKVDSTSDEN